MNWPVAILTIFVLLLIIIVVYQETKMRTIRSIGSGAWDSAGGDGAATHGGHGHSSGGGCGRPGSPEIGALRENCEYFGSVTGSGSGADDSMSKIDYAVHDFGAAGLTYKDWVTSQAVDPQVIANHAEFVKERTADVSQIVTGRTYSPDSHDSYNPQPWIGIRGRPQAVRVNNPDQVSDMDYSLFPTKAKLTWSSV